MDFSHEKFILQINLNQRIMEIKEASFKKKNTIERKEFMRPNLILICPNVVFVAFAQQYVRLNA